MRLFGSLQLLFVIVLLLVAFVNGYGTTREEVSKNLAKAKANMKKLLKEAKEKMKLHKKGKKKLNDKDVEILERKISGYQSALDKMNSRGEIDRMIERQKLEEARRKARSEL